MRTEYWTLNTEDSGRRQESIQYSVGQYSLSLARSGFTLIELLVVVAIMGIILTISVPFMNTAISGNKGITGAMRMVQEACADARALAILKQATATMTINGDGTINVQEGGGSSTRGRAESLDVAGNEWRMADRPAGGGGGGSARGGRVEMRQKYPLKLPEGVGIEAILANGLDATELESAAVRFYKDGTSDEFNMVLRHPESGEYRQVWLEITTGLPDFESDRTKFRMH
jgi:prepilin-type N-terminal cleavage/methylation domain-containing protein